MVIAETFESKDEKEKEKQEIGSPETLTTAEATTPVGGYATPTTPTQPRMAGTGRFQNLQKYIQANIPQREGVATTGERLRGRLETQAQEVGKGIQSAREKFGQQIGEIQQQLSPEEIQKLQSQIQTAPGEIDVEQFRKLATGGLQTEVEKLDPSLQRAISQTEAAQQQLGRVGTESGRFGMLREMFGAPGQRYTGGQQRLDQLLLQASGMGDITQAAKAQQQALGQQLTSAQEAAQAQMAGLLGEDETKGQIGEVAEQLAGAVGAEKEKVLGEQEAEMREFQKRLEKLPEMLSRGEITRETAESLGITEPIKHLYGLNVADYLQMPEMEALTKEQFINPEEAAKLTALSQLAGTGEQYIEGAGPQIAEWIPGGGGLEQLSKDIASRQATYEKERQPLESEINRLTRDITQRQIVENMMNAYLQGETESGQQIASKVGSPYGDVVTPGTWGQVAQGEEGLKGIYQRLQDLGLYKLPSPGSMYANVPYNEAQAKAAMTSNLLPKLQQTIEQQQALLTPAQKKYAELQGRYGMAPELFPQSYPGLKFID